MSLCRAFVLPTVMDEILSAGGHELDRETAHRFKNVLRCRNGDAIELFDGVGRVVSGILHVDRGCSLREAQIVTHQPESPRISVVQALVKMEKLEQIVQRCTELGVSEFTLFDAERSNVSFKDKGDAKIERLTRIAQDAARQSERVFVPKISFNSLSFQRRLESMDPSLRCLPAVALAKVGGDNGAAVVGDPDAELSLVSYLQLDDNLSHDLSIIIGPEGGLSPSEMTQLHAHNVTPVKWARHILRTETAAMAAVSVIEAHLTRIAALATFP